MSAFTSMLDKNLLKATSVARSPPNDLMQIVNFSASYAESVGL
jgi:hypothetical protein